SRRIRVTSEKSHNLKGFRRLRPQDLVARSGGFRWLSLVVLIAAAAEAVNHFPRSYNPAADKVTSFSCVGQLNDTRCANGRQTARLDTPGRAYRSSIGSWNRDPRTDRKYCELHNRCGNFRNPCDSSKRARVLGGPVMRIIVMLGVYGSLVLINIRGVREGAGAVTVITVAKLLPLLLFVSVGIFFIHGPNLSWNGWPSSKSLGDAVILLIFAFVGIEVALIPSGEVKNPARTVPRS